MELQDENDAPAAAGTAVTVSGVGHVYRSKKQGDRRALSDVSFDVRPGEIFGLLGPNGGGKTTLFKLLGTLLPLSEGTLSVDGIDVKADPAGVRTKLGVTFQSPSLDPKLTVWENVVCQGALYGITGRDLVQRAEPLLDAMGVLDRRKDFAETLSGGLKRRVEIAKGLLHDPKVLLLDEPSTGLDPGARFDLWTFLDRLRRDSDIAVLVTTHLMEEAERCDRLGLLSEGALIAVGSPDELRSNVGGDCVTLTSAASDQLATEIEQQFGIEAKRFGDTLRIESDNAADLVQRLYTTFPDAITSVSLGKPTLEDVFMQKTGHQFWEAEVS